MVPRNISSLRREIWLRVTLAIAVVLLVHAFDWMAWRKTTADVLIVSLHALGVASARITPDTVAVVGRFFRIEISCTFADALLPSIPLLWEFGDSLVRNMAALIFYLIIMSALNIVRLTFGFVLFAHGVPWWLGHQFVAGLFYFALLCWIGHRRNWTITFSQSRYGVHNEATI